MVRWPWSQRKPQLDATIERDLIEERLDKAKITRIQNNIRKERIRYLEQRYEELRSRQEQEIWERKISDLEDDLDDGEDDENPIEQIPETPEALLVGLLAKVLQNKDAANPIPAASQPPAAGIKVSVSDAQLRELKNRIPGSWMARLRKMSDEELLTTARTYLPDQFEQADDDTIARAMIILRE